MESLGNGSSDVRGENGSLLPTGLPESTPPSATTAGSLFEYCMSGGDSRPAHRGHRAVWEFFSKTADGKLPPPLAECGDPHIRNLYQDCDASNRHYPAFADEFFDWEEPLAAIGKYLWDAVSGGEAKRQILNIWGSNGCGKSTFISHLGRLMAKGKYYSVGNAQDKAATCQNHCSWLYLLPESEREQWLSRFWYFEGDPCKDCISLLQEKNDRWQDVPVVNRAFRLRAGQGIVLCERKLPQPPDSGAFPEEWYNAIFAANGGVFAFDLHSQPDEFVSLVSQMVTAGAVVLSDNISWATHDGMIVNITNEHPVALTNRYPNLRDRLYSVRIGAPLSYRWERRLFLKRAKERTFHSHFRPHVEELLAALSCASRMNNHPNLSIWEKVRLHAGEIILRDNKPFSKTRRQLRNEGNCKEDGYEGLLPRLSVRLHGEALQRGNCIGIADVIAAVRSCTESLDAAIVGASAKGRLETFLGDGPLEALPERKGKDKEKPPEPGLLEKEYQRKVWNDFIEAMLGLGVLANYQKELFGRYLNHAGACVNKTDVEETYGDRIIQQKPDEPFLRSIEECGDVSSHKAGDFRRDVVLHFFQIQRKEKRDVTMADHPHLEQMLGVFIKKEQSGKIATLLRLMFGGGMTKKEEDQKTMLFRNLRDLGYGDCCRDAVILYTYRNVFNS